MRELRKYTVKDLNVVIKLLKELRSEKYKKLLAPAINANSGPATDDEAFISIGQTIADILIEMWENTSEVLLAWFADLNQLPEDEFLAGDPSIVIETIEAIVTRPESRSFFSNAYQAYNRILDTSTTT